MTPRGLLIALCLISLAVAYAQSDAAKRTAALLELQRKSSTGVIDLSPAQFEEFVTGKTRPYSLIVIADSVNMRYQGKLNLGELLKEFSLVARTFAKEYEGTLNGKKVFFCKVEFTNAKDVFGRLGIKSLPWLARIPPSMPVSKDGAVKLKSEQDLMSGHSYPWSAEDMAGFVEEKTGLRVGEIKRTSFLHSRFMPFITLTFVFGAAFIGYHLYYSPYLRNTEIYIVGALVIWWFSVSGGMFNIIRGVPLVGYDPRSKQATLFMSGSGQLGAEGFIMGSLYTAFGLAVAAFTILGPRVKGESGKRTLGYACLGLMFFAYRMITANHHWKTGMVAHWYW